MTDKSQQVESASLTAGSSSDVESALLAYSQLVHQDLSRNRFAEEREWYETALFYQRRQWLKWDNSNRRWSVIKQSKDKPRPMPVTNHFARTINATANQLSSGQVKLNAVPNDDSDANRRASEFAEMACKGIDKETQFKLLIPLLGKHTTLWGMGITKDYYDTSLSNGTVKIPQMEVSTTHNVGCLDCGNVEDVSGIMAANAGAIAPGQQEVPCPECKSPNTVGWQMDQPVVTEVKQFSKGRMVTEVRPPFEVFVPRDCQNPNTARKIQHRYRKPLSEAKRIWGKKAEELKADTKLEIHEIYLEALRSLVNYNYMHDQTSESVTITETWVMFDQLADKLQETLREAVQSQDKGDEEDDLEQGPQSATPAQGDGFSANPDEPASAGGRSDDGGDSGTGDEGLEDDLLEAPDGELDPIEQLEQWGVYVIEAGGVVLDWGINPMEGKMPFTFYLWELDPANVYPKGLGVDLVPLQKRLNRVDSLVELAIMSNAAGKWLWPTTQTGQRPSGSPSDVIEYDPIGDGKIKPEFVLPTPFHNAVTIVREAILNDMMVLGMTQGVQQGMNPQGVTAFRGLAYLGAKAAEQISTQRFLWETAHGLRYEKCLILARRNWSESRKVKVAGFNGRWGMKQLFGRDLEGDYMLEIQPDSSRPQTLEEKEQAFQMLLEGGLVDVTDSQTREYVISDLANLSGVNLVNDLQYKKAERDLDGVIEGQMPAPNPYIDLNIQLKTFTNFTLTEEFDALDPQAQMQVAMYTQQLQQKQAMQQMQQVASMAEAAAPAIVPKLAQAMQKKNGEKSTSPLNGVPGQTTSPDAASGGAEAEAGKIASALP